MPTSAAGHVVGIDLGTTNSLVAYVENGLPVVIRDDDGSALLPSVVAITAGGAVHVGKDAQRHLLIDAPRTAYSIKRLMGKGRADVAAEEKYFPFRVTGDDRGVIRVALGERELTPPELSAFILRELKRRAEEHFQRRGERDVVVDRAVITVPAYFDDAQRTATRDAGRIAGLEVLRIINEPTAASLAYGLDRGDNAPHAGHPHSGTIAVYDFGGGTFDISILRVEDGVFQVLATNGDTHLGGDDIDRLIVQRVLAARDGSPDPESLQAIRMAAVQAKWDLSEQEEATLDGTTFRRVELESLIAPLVDRTLASCRQALADAGLDARQVDEVVLVGGSTRIPFVRQRVEDLFGRAPHSSLDPDEVVALGAALQANNLVTANRDMLLLDVTPLSLGIETMGGVVSRIIVRNSTIPATGREMFTTAADNQTGVDIHVLQGERERVSDNRSLARFSLRGIPPMPAGMARVEVQFQIDANGILNVIAHELRTDVAQTVEVKPSYGLTDEEVERMLLDSLEHAEEDITVRRLIEARNEAETVIRATEKTLRSPEMEDIQRTDMTPDGLTKDEQTRIVAILGALKMVLGSSDVEIIRRWTQALNDATAHLAEVALNRSVRAALTGRNVDEL